MPYSEKRLEFGSLDPTIARLLSELMEQTTREPVSPRLRDLAQQLETALAAAHRQRAGDQDPT